MRENLSALVYHLPWEQENKFGKNAMLVGSFNAGFSDQFAALNRK